MRFLNPAYSSLLWGLRKRRKKMVVTRSGASLDFLLPGQDVTALKIIKGRGRKRKIKREVKEEPAWEDWGDIPQYGFDKTPKRTPKRAPKRSRKRSTADSFPANSSNARSIDVPGPSGSRNQAESEMTVPLPPFATLTRPKHKTPRYNRVDWSKPIDPEYYPSGHKRVPMDELLFTNIENPYDWCKSIDPKYPHEDKKLSVEELRFPEVGNRARENSLVNRTKESSPVKFIKDLSKVTSIKIEPEEGSQVPVIKTEPIQLDCDNRSDKEKVKFRLKCEDIIEIFTDSGENLPRVEKEVILDAAGFQINDEEVIIYYEASDEEEIIFPASATTTVQKVASNIEETVPKKTPSKAAAEVEITVSEEQAELERSGILAKPTDVDKTQVEAVHKKSPLNAAEVPITASDEQQELEPSSVVSKTRKKRTKKVKEIKNYCW